MRRLLKPRISPLESFLNRASQPVPSSSRPYYLSADQNDNAATALLNTLSPTDVLHLRLVSKSVHDWTNARLDELFSTLYYTLTITKQETGTIVRTPTALAPLRTIGQSCTHFIITILSPTPPSIRTSTPTPQSYSASTSNANLPKPASYPQLLTHLLKHLLTHLLPALHTLTLSLPDPKPWRPEPTTHSTLIHIRQALESLPPTTNLRTLNFNPVSLVHLVSLRWRGLSVYGGEAGWTGARFWNGVRALDVVIFIPLEVYTGGRRGEGRRARGRDQRRSAGGEEVGDREMREGHLRMGMKVLHDWLAGFGSGLELLGFEWLALPEAEEDGSEHDDPEPESEAERAVQITGPNPLTLHLNNTPFSFTFSPSPSLHVTSYPPSGHQHQHQTAHPALSTSTSTQPSTGTTPHSGGPYRERRFSAPRIRWDNLSEVWLRGVEIEALGTWMAGVRSLERVYFYEEGVAEDDEEAEEDGEEGGRWVRFDGVGLIGKGEGEGEGEEEGQKEGGDGPSREDVSVDVRFVLDS